MFYYTLFGAIGMVLTLIDDWKSKRYVNICAVYALIVFGVISWCTFPK
jgi:hypothetical protein